MCTVATRVERSALVGPQRLDDTVDRHHMAAGGHQHREQTTLLPAPERGPSARCDDINRAKNTELHETPRRTLRNRVDSEMKGG